MKKNKPSLRCRLFLLYIGSFAVSIGPLFAVFFANIDKYTETPADTVKLCFGGLICVIFVLLKIVGRLGMPKRIFVFGIVFALSYFLDALLSDLTLLSGMAFMGEFFDYVVFQRMIARTREKILLEKGAGTTADKVEEVIKKYIERS